MSQQLLLYIIKTIITSKKLKTGGDTSPPSLRYN